ncbi:MAG: isochorismatase family protein [bacterium]
MIERISKSAKKREFQFYPRTSALLVIDMQDYFLKKSSHAFLPSATAIIPNIKKLINYFRGKRPIIFTQHINTEKNAGMLKKWWDDIITTDDEYYKLSKKLYSPDAVVVPKTQYDAFYKTNLEELLCKHQVKQVVITGVMTNLCCETTARTAFILGFEVFFVVDGTATQNIQMHQATLLNLAYGFATPVLTQDIIKSFKQKH